MMADTTNHSRLPPLTASLLFILALIFSLLFNGLNLIWFSLSQAFLILLAFVTVRRNYDRGFPIRYPWLTLAMMLFWLWLGLNIAFSQVTYLATINFWWVGSLPLLYLIFTFMPEHEDFWKTLVMLLLAIGLLLCLHAIYQYYLVNGQPHATFLNRNSLAVFVNLLIFPAIALFLTARNRSRAGLMLLVILLFAYTIGIIRSRGAGLGFVLGFGLFFLFSYRQVSLKRWAALLATIIMAVLLATLSAKLNPLSIDTSLLERFASLQDVDKAGHDRFVIWQPAWRLFLEHPLFGIGLGSYYLAIPPYLHLEDFSAQYYVHNDYLQIALETGLPGLLLFLSLYIFALRQFICGIKASHDKPATRVQLLGVSSALLAVSFHGFFTFIIYTLPLTLLLGLYFGRLNQLAEQASGLPVTRSFRPHFLRKGIYSLVTALTGAIILFYFTSLGISTYYSNKGIALAEHGFLREAHEALMLAQVFAPKLDTAFYKDAELLQKTARFIHDNEEVKHDVLLEAEQKALHAARLNPLRPRSPYILARIYEQSRPDDAGLILQKYNEALELNPRFLQARLALARRLYALGRVRDAYNVIRNGFPYVYRSLTPAFMNYLALGVSVCQDLGDDELAEAMQKRIEFYRQQLDKLQAESDPGGR